MVVGDNNKDEVEDFLFLWFLACLDDTLYEGRH